MAINYPTRKRMTKKTATYSNRGMGLESLILKTNNNIFAKGWGVIDKVATPVKIIRKERGRIKDGIVSKSTVDFQGHYKGIPVAFDAKETAVKTSFPLDNVEPHQVRYLQNWKDTGGAAFFIIEFTGLKKVFYMDIAEFMTYWRRMEEGGRKSITLAEFKTEVKSGRGILLDYGKILEGAKK